MSRIDSFKQALMEKRAVKIIAGIDNFDADRVKNVVLAADQAGASAVDICADREIISMVRELTNMPIFVSSIKPQNLAMSIAMGADAIELGNFDALYKNGISMTGSQVMDLVRETLSMINKEEVFFSVTIPGNIEISEQISMARELESMGIDLIQTEGHYSNTDIPNGVRGLVERAELTISNTIELSRNVEVPVMTATGINPTTASLAFAAGASAIGCGSCVNKLDSEISMIAVSKELVEIANRNVVREHQLV
ncbi:TPA: hypothetical protein CPT80_07765 [Candidatus Gastranaerophilales bacterium HUM_9]|nr:MAG TPA: hypothetical protein CPT80_07765 [Candidatus Gastranaerophilales bacterium HUM_9]HBX35112.1 DUF561 domain-containing protein [Cyanobacteria bacterium UBA11440]